jgi:two-component system, LuxR family, response regulator DctR
MLVFIVDDDQAIRHAVTWLLRSRQLASESFESAESFMSFLSTARYAEHVKQQTPCLLLLDVRMEGMSGLQLFEWLRERGTTAVLPVIFLTGHAEVAMAVEAVKAGAFDFFEKPLADNRLVDRVMQALAHARSLHQANASLSDLDRRLRTLTDREREVMNLIMQGRLNKVIADELAISMRTVEVHRARIFEKLQVRSAVEMVNLLSKQNT